MTAVPFLKWPGGKRWLTSAHRDLFPSEFGRYIEPFLGSGAVYFALAPRRAVLGDVNRDLVEVYQCLKRDWARVATRLAEHQRRHGSDYYYEIRDQEPSDPVERAARLVYLNRTCFNGIYRVNRAGRFNVPKGTKDKVILPTDDFEAVARLLRGARLCEADFERLVDAAEPGDLVFADPPYTVRHNNNAFVKYNETLFSWNDQERLADSLARAAQRGVKIVATNANHPSVRKLYRRPEFHLQTVSRVSPISATPASRGRYEELVILGNREAPGR